MRGAAVRELPEDVAGVSVVQPSMYVALRGREESADAVQPASRFFLWFRYSVHIPL